MKVLIFAIKDELVGFMNPTFEQTEQVALRNFSFAINKADSLLYTNAKDYSLWLLGEYDTEKGIIAKEHKKIADALSVKEAKVA